MTCVVVFLRDSVFHVELSSTATTTVIKSIRADQALTARPRFSVETAFIDEAMTAQVLACVAMRASDVISMQIKVMSELVESSNRVVKGFHIRPLMLVAFCLYLKSGDRSSNCTERFIRRVVLLDLAVVEYAEESTIIQAKKRGF